MVDSFKGLKVWREIIRVLKTQAEGSATHWKKLLFSFERPDNRGSKFDIRGTNGNSLPNRELKSSVKWKLTQTLRIEVKAVMLDERS